MTRQRIAILGGELSGAMAAASLRFYLPIQNFEIIYVHSGPLFRPEWCMTSYADIRQFNNNLKISEGAFAQKCAAGLKLGERYTGWGKTPYINSFVDYGVNIRGVDFIDIMLRQDQYKSIEDLVPYSLPVRAALEGKFLPPDSKGRPIVSDFDYAYHFNPQAYADLLLDKAKEFGLEITEDKSVLSSADLIINATGKAMNGELESAANFQTWEGCSSFTAVTLPPQTDRLGLLTDITTSPEGWSFNASTQTEDVHIDFYFDSAKGEHPYTCGRLLEPWAGKVLNIGSAAICVEPLMGSPLRLIQNDIERLIKLFPPNLKDPIERQEYNRQATSTYDRLRDYHALQYKTSCAWDLDITLTTHAQHKLDVFAARGRLATYDDDMLFRDNWTSLFLGQGITPQRYDTFAEDLEPEDIRKQLDAIENIISQALKSMPRHEDFIARQCPAQGFAYS